MVKGVLSSMLVTLFTVVCLSVALADEFSVYLPGLGSLQGTLSPNGKARVFRGFVTLSPLNRSMITVL